MFKDKVHFKFTGYVNKHKKIQSSPTSEHIVCMAFTELKSVGHIFSCQLHNCYNDMSDIKKYKHLDVDLLDFYTIHGIQTLRSTFKPSPLRKPQVSNNMQSSYAKTKEHRI